MKSKKEIQKYLDELLEVDENELGSPEFELHQGWIEALTYVLHNPYDTENLPPHILKVLQKIENEIYYNYGYKNKSGGYVYTKIVGEDVTSDPDNPSEDIEIYLLEVEHGISDNEKNIIELAIRKDDFSFINE